MVYLAELQRSHVYHMTFPPDWKNNDIKKIFNPFSKFFFMFLFGIHNNLLCRYDL